MDDKYYTVRVAIDTEKNAVIGTALHVVCDWAMPNDKKWHRGKFEFKEKSFDTLEEAEEFKRLYDNYKGGVNM